MPDYAYGFQVCIAPFAVTTPRACIRPLKIGEYLMAGRPVVSTDLPEIVRGFAGLVAIAASTEEFIAACRQAAEHPDAETIQRGRRAMAAREWKHAVAAWSTSRTHRSVNRHDWLLRPAGSCRCVREYKMP